MQLHLDGKVVLVTDRWYKGYREGDCGSINAHADDSLAEGATVHFCSRTANEVQTSEAALSSSFPSAKAIGAVVDVAQPDQITSWVSRAAQQSNHIDVVVSNVSALSIPNTPESWTSSFHIDMMGIVTLVSAALPHLEKTKGNIIAISSVSGRDIDFTAPGPYGAFKAALIHYISQLAHVHAPKGVRANTVSPGNIYIEDGVWGGIEKGNPELFKAQFEKNPMGRMGRPQEIADAVVFLASERSAFTSGANFVVDGAVCNGVQF
ncbi:hypothetical protein LTR50_001921 [Elasticomyces elasticus]|nr:hypothetical protein LTR50_001921 [Elasticomyces elasticus]